MDRTAEAELRILPPPPESRPFRTSDACAQSDDRQIPSIETLRWTGAPLTTQYSGDPGEVFRAITDLCSMHRSARCNPDRGLGETPTVGHQTGRPDGAVNWSEMSVLMARVQAGDREAYRTLLGLLIPWLRRVAGRRLNRIEDVEDTVQEVLVSLHAVRHTYDSTRAFQPWIMTLAQRRIADRLRNNYQLIRRELPLPEDAGESLPAAVSDGMNTRVELEPAALTRALTTLSPRQRQAIELLRLQEMSLKEAATISGRSETSLRVAMHRALASLRRAFGVG